VISIIASVAQFWRDPHVGFRKHQRAGDAAIIRSDGDKAVEHD
jgi:hypothetical protein